MQSNLFCSHCHRNVPSTSHAGQLCPHCGLYWSDVQKGAPYETEEMRKKRIQKGIGNLVLLIIFVVLCVIVHYN